MRGNAAVQVAAAVFALAVADCAMRATVNLSIDEPSENTIQAWEYPSRDGDSVHSRYYSIGINLAAAPQFVVVLPDGYPVNSKQIDASLLALHFAPVAVDVSGNLISNIHYADEQKRYWMIFSLQKSGKASHLSLYACRHALTGVLESVDGRRSFDVPIKQAELVDLFSGPARIGRDFEILGSNCD